MEEVKQRRIIKEQPKYEDAPDPPTIEEKTSEAVDNAKKIIDNETMTSTEEEFLKFVTTNVSKMKDHFVLNGEESPSLDKLNRALGSHSHIMLALTTLYEQNRWAKTQAQDDFDLWYAQKFLEVRTEVNKSDVAKSKWYTKEEIDMMVKVKFKDEYKKYKSEINLAESKRSTLQRLVDGWNSYQFILTQLSKNSIAELNSVSKEVYNE